MTDIAMPTCTREDWSATSPDRDRLIALIAQAAAVSDDADWQTLREAQRDQLAMLAMDVLDALTAAGLAVVLVPGQTTDPQGMHQRGQP